MTGKILGGRYEILEKIGEGGMAVVYRAHCNKLDRFVAIKILKEEFGEDEEFIKKFHRESRSAGHLNDPHIVNVYDVGEDEIDGKIIHYIVMELVEGETLKEKIKKGELTPKKAVKYAKEIAQALKVAHNNHIIHRDIKPHNILIDKEDRVKVADFGIARAITNFTITTTSNVLGSVHYFSPEQARGGYTDAKSDLYSLGVVMYEMATGKLPYEAETPIAVAMKHVQEEPIPPREINPEISEDFEKVILKSLKKRQSDRYQSAEELIRDLNRVENGNSVDISESIQDDETRIMPALAIEDEERENLLKEDKVSKKSFNKSMPIFAGIIVAIIIFGIFLVVRNGLNGMFTDNPDIPVPSVIGKSLEDAKKILSDAGLTYKTVEVESKEAPGTVVMQEPKEGTAIKKDFPLTLSVAKGSGKIIMPDVRDLAVEEANRELEEAGIFLNPNDISYDISETVPKDAVIEQYPAPNTEIEEGEKVRITISRGKKGDTIIVPYVIGKTLDEAKKKFEEEMITKITVKQERNTSYAEGIVYYQSISAGEIIDNETPVELYVSLGGEEEKPEEKPKEEPKEEEEEPKEDEKKIQTKSITLSPKQGVETTNIQIIKVYEGISEVVYNKDLKETDNPINVNLNGYEGTSFDILYNGNYESTVTIP